MKAPLSNVLALCALAASAFPPSIAAAGPAPGSAVRTVRVDCAAGEKVAKALRLPADQLVVELSGTCVEDLVIERSGVTLKGITPDATLQGDATSPGSNVLIRGASRVDLQDLAITGGEAVGVRLQRNAEARLRNVRITGVPFFGLFLEESSSALVEDTVVAEHGFFGVTVFDSVLTVQGINDFSRNGQIGLLLSSGAALHTNGDGRIIANDNGASGVALQAGAAGFFPSVEARGNGIAGIDLSFGGELTSIGSNNDFSDNGVFGVVAGDGARYFAAARVVNNGSVGIFAEEGTHVNVATDQPSNVTGSPVDVILAGGTGTFGGTTQQTGLVVIGTIELTFGSRASFGADATVGTLTCDGTVLTQGAFSCPTSLDSLRVGSAWLRHDLPRPQRPVLPELP